MVWPAEPYPVEVVDLVRVRLDDAVLDTVTVEAAEVTTVLDGLVPCEVATLVTDPASTSAWVTVYMPVQVSLPPGDSVPDGQLTEFLLSVTPTEVSVVVPVLVTR